MSVCGSARFALSACMWPNGEKIHRFGYFFRPSAFFCVLQSIKWRLFGLLFELNKSLEFHWKKKFPKMVCCRDFELCKDIWCRSFRLSNSLRISEEDILLIFMSAIFWLLFWKLGHFPHNLLVTLSASHKKVTIRQS
jgi:hypothetical protein